jgi:hypothetical protein
MASHLPKQYRFLIEGSLATFSSLWNEFGSRLRLLRMEDLSSRAPDSDDAPQDKAPREKQKNYVKGTTGKQVALEFAKKHGEFAVRDLEKVFADLQFKPNSVSPRLNELRKDGKVKFLGSGRYKYVGG